MTEDLHPYDGRTRRFRHTDADPQLCELGATELLDADEELDRETRGTTPDDSGESPDDTQRVHLLTAHSAKGLESGAMVAWSKAFDNPKEAADVMARLPREAKFHERAILLGHEPVANLGPGETAGKDVGDLLRAIASAAP